MEQGNIRDILETYARKVEYRLEDLCIPSKGDDPLLVIHRVGKANNSFCQDKMYIYMRIDNQMLTLQHYGEYCGLSNASAEIFCEAVTGLSIDEFTTLLESLTLYLRTSNEDALIQGDKYQLMYDLIKVPMSSTRKRCITLPWEASIDALKN